MTVDKSPDAFRTISEVADDLDLPQHVLRFWETRFAQIRPLKRGGGRRYYRPDDIDLLRGIRHLLYGEGYTIKGVQRILKEQGVRFVMQVWREDGVPLAALAAQAAAAAADDELDAPAMSRSAPPMAPQAALLPAEPSRRSPAPAAALSGPAAAPVKGREAEDLRRAPAAVIEADPDPIPRGILPEGVQPPAPARSGGGFRLMERLLGERADTAQPAGSLSRDDIRRLQATLFELLECKRILDQAR